MMRRPSTTVMHAILATWVLGLVCAAPAWATWPTTQWTIEEEETTRLERILPSRLPEGKRLMMARKHTDMLRKASSWYQSMAFPAPRQIGENRKLELEEGERYLAYLKQDSSKISSGHADEDGTMYLSSNPGFLYPKTSFEHLMEAAAVHELFHAIQGNYALIRLSPGLPQPGPPECRATPFDSRTKKGLAIEDWLTEGTAAYLQIRWLERTHGYQYGHPFKGSPRASWMRFFDQPLDWGSLPANLRNSAAKGESLISANKAKGQSWWCSYGTWYFWYAMGEMLGSKQTIDRRRQTYLQYIFEQPGPLKKTGLAQVDAGLKAAGTAYDVISAYQGGLFTLYPLFVAHYLDDERFYEHLQEVALASPDLYKADSADSGGPLQPIASRAWLLRINLPEDSADSIPYNIRVVLETPDKARRESLHLIVDRTVVSPPADPTVLYSYTTQSKQWPRNENGQIELLVRVANVARDAAKTEETNFTLRVEVDGFYGKEPDSSWADRIGGQLPPGFEIRGPGALWNCTGGANARASFTLITPDAAATELERLPGQMQRNLENVLKQMETEFKERSDKGTANPLSLDEFKALRIQTEDRLASLLAGHVGTTVEAGADKLRQKKDTTLSAQFTGQNDGEACHMMLRATLSGRAGGAQKVRGDAFSISAFPAQALGSMGKLQALAASGDSEWSVCDEKQYDCKKAPELILEHAEPNHLAGSFWFQVVRVDEHGEPLEYQPVFGHFNSTSTHTNQDSGLLEHLNRITNTATGDIPWIKRALPGGSILKQ